METNVNYTAVGAFVITLFTFIVIGIIWLSSGFSVGQYNLYTVYMSESVAGLSVDSTVEFNGVDVGTVKSIEIDQHNPHLVVLSLRIKNTTPVTRGTRAILTSKGLTGVAYMSLIDQGKDLTPLLAPPGEPYPVIFTAPSFLGRLDTILSKLASTMSKVGDSIQALLNEENLQSIREILLNTKHVSRTLAAHSDEIATILQNTSKSSVQLPLLLQSSRETVRIMNTQILPATSQAMSNLDVLSNNLTDLSIELKQNPSILIRGKQQHLGPGEK